MFLKLKSGGISSLSSPLNLLNSCWTCDRAWAGRESETRLRVTQSDTSRSYQRDLWAQWMAKSWGRAAVSQETICIVESRAPGKMWWAGQSANPSFGDPPQSLLPKTRSTLKPIRDQTLFWCFTTTLPNKCVQTRWWSSFAGMWGWKWGSSNGFWVFFAVLGMDLMVWGSTRLGLAKAPSKGGSELVPVVGNWAEPSINGANPAQLPECLKKDLERKLHY